MTLWLAIPLILLLLVVLLFLLVLASSIHFHFRVRRLGKDDRIEFDIKAVYGLVKFHYEVPALVFQSIEQGIKLKVEKSGMAPVKRDSEKEQRVDKESVTHWLKNMRTALKATRGLKKWLRGTLSHVKISQFDWSTDFSLGDAATTATAVGALWGFKWTMIGAVSCFVRLMQSPRIFVAPVFRDEPSFATEAVCAGKLSAGYALYAGLLLLRRVSKVEGGLGRWKKLLSREHS